MIVFIIYGTDKELSMSDSKKIYTELLLNGQVTYNKIRYQLSILEGSKMLLVNSVDAIEIY